MINRHRINKAFWSLKNEGPLVFSKKLIRFLPWAVKRTHIKYSRYLPRPLRANFGRYDDDYLYLHNPIFNVTAEDIVKSQAVKSGRAPKKVASATWFVPYFDHLKFGGIYTIFRFIDYLAEQGVANHIVIYDRPDLKVDQMMNEIVTHFPNLKTAKVSSFNQRRDKVADLPATDIAICTFWVSAYFLLRFNQTKRKYYFVQDYEPLFYQAGSLYALAESTYRFGFNGIVNTPGLLWALNQRHGFEGTSFIPAVDSHIYYPPSMPRNSRKIRVFFYARPNNPRNAFELGILTIKILLKKYRDKIEIVTAGSDWKEGKFDLGGDITNLGLLKNLEDVGELYRSCDIGFVFMLSKHPSYQPFEFMACGMATVSNRNEDNLWLFKDGQNCLLAEPSPAAMAEAIGRLVDDNNLRQKIAEEGRRNINHDWQPQLDDVWRYINKN